MWTAGKDSRRTDLSTGKVSTAILLAQEPLTAAPLAADQWERLITRLADRSGRRRDTLAGLPFSPDDVTAGSETELQAAVAGGAADVDLPCSIRASNYYANVVKRSMAKDTPKRALLDLQQHIAADGQRVWDNSWVRFALRRLSPHARQTLDHDLLADKRDPARGRRGDCQRFLVTGPGGEAQLRVPISYLLKLALADALGAQPDLSPELQETGRRLMRHFLNDNISPETSSFQVVSLRARDGLGRGLAKETSLRFLFTQLLTAYANDRFGLQASGQRAMVYFSPHPPIRQKQLNDCISDAFYRELFVSPCLSGWDEGERKRDYMYLCHQALSRSQLYAVAKVRDAGLIAGGLMMLPALSNISLANNGIHVSLGSRKLQGLLCDPTSGFGAAEEKRTGDLAIKVVEHFLPLFVGAYSAAPYRFDFADFHPEKVLGFLPHELDYTHLRMLWRRWKKKAANRILGQPLVPSGYAWLDRPLSAVFGLRGDYVPDFRLLDYLVAPLSTHQCPGFDGRLGNTDRLKTDLADHGVFDDRMAFYALYRLRAFAQMGFSGFEGRYYSLCESLAEDLRRGVDLQNLVTALAFQYIVDGQVVPADIPDDPSVESERRQIFFGTAIGIPTFYVRAQTQNTLLRRILANTQRTRNSHRYPGYVRVYNLEYRRALLRVLRRDAAGLIDMLGLRETLADLEQRIESPERHSTAGRLTGAILDSLGARSPFDASATEFNLAAEAYYRDGLRRKQMQEAFAYLEEDLLGSQRVAVESARAAHCLGLGTRGMAGFLRDTARDLLADCAAAADVQTLINVMLWNVRHADAEAQSDL